MRGPFFLIAKRLTFVVEFEIYFMGGVMEKPVSQMTTQEVIAEAMSRVRGQHATVSNGHTLARLQEAFFWQNQFEKEIAGIARQQQVGPHMRSAANPGRPDLGGVVLTEPLEDLIPPVQPPPQKTE